VARDDGCVHVQAEGETLAPRRGASVALEDVEGYALLAEELGQKEAPDSGTDDDYVEWL